jgi:hypothetical protein
MTSLNRATEYTEYTDRDRMQVEAMASIRRHLASLGLTVVLCHVVMQVLVPAVLCCQQTAAPADEADDCCAGTHPGQVCPMHRSARGGGDRSTNDCHAKPQRDFLDLLVVLNTGVLAPSTTELIVTLRSEAAFVPPQHRAASLAPAPPGPPPRA